MRVTLEEIGGRGQNKPYDIQELMAVLMSRALQDGETVGTGAGSAVARAACRLAQLLHAPNLNFIAGGSGAINPFLEPLVASSCDYNNLDCEATLPVIEYVMSLCRGRLDVFFYGGIQIDKFGNVNLSVLGDPAKPKLRGPGCAALPLVTNAKRSIIFLTDHSPRTFVEKVSFITAPGYLDGAATWQQAKADGFITGGGPTLVISPLAVFDFEETTKQMRLVSLHPNTTLETTQAATGFELILPTDIPTTVAPHPHELNLLRQIDANRLLRPM